MRKAAGKLDIDANSWCLFNNALSIVNSYNKDISVNLKKYRSQWMKYKKEDTDVRHADR